MTSLIIAYALIAVFLFGYTASIVWRTRKINQALQEEP